MSNRELEIMKLQNRIAKLERNFENAKLIDGTYWAFYINDEMSMKGVDQTEIVAGKTYEFKAEK